MSLLLVKTNLNCHVASHDNLPEKSCKCLGGGPCSMAPPWTIVTKNIVIVEIYFKLVLWPLLGTCLKGYMNLWVEAPHRESLPCHIWWPLVYTKWGIKYLMSNDLTKPHDQGINLWVEALHGKSPHHLAKFGRHRYCSRDKIFLVCHVIKQDYEIKGSDDYNDMSPGM